MDRPPTRRTAGKQPRKFVSCGSLGDPSPFDPVGKSGDRSCGAVAQHRKEQSAPINDWASLKSNLRCKGKSRSHGWGTRLQPRGNGFPTLLSLDEVIVRSGSSAGPPPSIAPLLQADLPSRRTVPERRELFLTPPSIARKILIPYVSGSAFFRSRPCFAG
jgi:hypothetical protein